MVIPGVENYFLVGMLLTMTFLLTLKIMFTELVVREELGKLLCMSWLFLVHVCTPYVVSNFNHYIQLTTKQVPKVTPLDL